MATAARAAPLPLPVTPRRNPSGSPARLASLRPASRDGAPPAMRAVLAMDAGEPLRLPVRAALERGLGADLRTVRVHRSPAAQQMVAGAKARALARGADIFLGPGESENDVGLLAHEAAHVVQQQGGPAVPQRMALAGRGDALEAEADRASATVVAGGSYLVSGRTAARPQAGLGDWIRSGVSAVAGAVADIAGAALNFIRDHARVIPGYDMLALIAGRDPITQQAVERTPVNIIRAFMGLWPGGSLVFDALQRYGIVDRVGNWLTTQIGALGRIVGGIRAALDRFIDTLGPADVLRLGEVWDRARRIFSEPITQVMDFVRNLASDVLQFIRDAVLRPIARLAEGTRAYDLLRLVLGRDPITGDPYPRTPENLIGGFMRLIGQEEKWRQLQESRAIPRAWAWFQQQMGTLMNFVSEVPALFLTALRSFSIGDLLDLPGAFGRMRQIFGGFVSRFLTWAGAAAYEIMMFIFEVLAPGAMPVLRRAAAVFRIIIGDPIRFVGNLVRAGIQGFRQFLTNILRHLLNGLVGWLTGALAGAGLTLPSTWDLRGVISLVLQILGLTWQNIRTKLVRVLGERVVATLETTFDVVMTLVRDGPAAAWQKIVEQLGNLRDMVFAQIRDWVTRTIVGQAVMRIVSMLNPAGAVIQAIIAIYNTIMFVRERLTQIIQVAESYLNAIAEIASGAIGTAANKVEETMGRLVPVVISFLARLIGLGGISDAIRRIIDRIRAPIDRALDRVVDWLVAQARRIGSAIAGAMGRRGGAAASGITRDSPPDVRKQAAKTQVEAALARGMVGSALASLLARVRRETFLSDLRIVRGANQRVKLQFLASDPLDLDLGTPDRTVSGEGARPATGRVTYTGTSAVATPFAAVRAVYGAASMDPAFGWRVQQATWMRPNQASALLRGDLASDVRTDVIGHSGAIGVDEHRLLRGQQQSYHGGHLVGLQLAGVDTNDARNLAPQRGSFNSGTYLQLENTVRASPIPQAGGPKSMTADLRITVNVSYPADSYSVTHAQLVQVGALKATAPPGPAVTIPRRIPNRWQMTLAVETAGFVLQTRAPSAGTQMASQARGTQAGNASFIGPNDVFVWWRVGSVPNPAQTTVGGGRTETIVAEQAVP